jgi:hypothetical protein
MDCRDLEDQEREACIEYDEGEPAARASLLVEDLV